MKLGTGFVLGAMTFGITVTMISIFGTGYNYGEWTTQNAAIQAGVGVRETIHVKDGKVLWFPKTTFRFLPKDS